jgi:hypothetical protein
VTGQGPLASRLGAIVEGAEAGIDGSAQPGGEAARGAGRRQLLQRGNQDVAGALALLAQPGLDEVGDGGRKEAAVGGRRAVHPGLDERLAGDELGLPIEEAIFDGHHRVAAGHLPASAASAGEDRIEARQLAIWFHRSFGGPANFAPGPFVSPPDPAQETKALAAELERLRKEVAEAKLSAEAAAAAAREEARRHLSAEERAQRDAQDLAIWQHLAEEAEKKLIAALSTAQAQAVARPYQASAIAAQALEAGQHLELDEAETRALIDSQLRKAPASRYLRAVGSFR